MDDPFAGDERQHKSWRDLPPTPPLVWPTTGPAFATAAVGAPAFPRPTAEASRRPRRRLVGTALLVGAISSSAPGCSPTATVSGRCWRRPPRPEARADRTRPPRLARADRTRPPRRSRRATSRSRTRPRGSCLRSCRSRPAARSAPGSSRPKGASSSPLRMSSVDRESGHAPALRRHEHFRRRRRGRQVHRHCGHPGRGGRCGRSEAIRSRSPRRCAGGRDDDRHREPVRPRARR